MSPPRVRGPALPALILVVCTACSLPGRLLVPAAPEQPPAVRPSPGREGASTAVPPASTAVPPAALRILHRWDDRRARAYATGSVAALRHLYLSGSDAGRTDVRLLGEYVARGYRVRGMRMQVLAVAVLSHRPGRLRLAVTDRLEHAVAVGHGARTVLPRDQASTRVLVLVRGPHTGWRIGSVAQR